MTTNEIHPIHWKNKIICNNCPRVHECDATEEWYDMQYTMSLHVIGTEIYPLRKSPKNNKCPYEKTLDK